MRLEFSSRAESDLEAIMDYLAQEAGPETALRYGQKIREECCKVCAAPGMGKRHPIHFRIRKIIVGPHKIFYREDPGRIVIHRIWDGRRGTNPKLRSSP